MADELMTVDEVATMLRLDPQTIRKWLRLGTLPGFRLGSKQAGWRVRRSEVEQFLEAQRGEGAAA
jgi:excisionase family DNA binding protein